jgi:serine/threonine protein kinase
MSPSDPPPATAELPSPFGPYRIERLLGAGGMGSVYLATDTRLDRLVAVKVPHFTAADGPEVLDRFDREAKAAAALDHPNLCTVFESGRIDGRPYLTMAFIDGRPLSDFLGGKLLPVRKAALLVRKVALGLAAAHDRGIVHRDLKPANIMLKKTGEPVVTDFGLARRFGGADKRITQRGFVLGTPQYMSPEQVRGEDDQIGPATDVWALGVILYECLTGRPPFDAPGMAVVGDIVMKEPAPPTHLRPEIGPAVEAVCLKALAKDPAARCASMAEFARALAEALNQRPTDDTFMPLRANADNVFADLIPDRPVLPTPPPTRGVIRPRAKPSRGPIVAAVVTGMLTLAAIGVWVAGHPTPSQPSVPTIATGRPAPRAASSPRVDPPPPRNQDVVGNAGPVITTASATATLVKLHSWERGQPATTIMPTGQGFCALAGVTGHFLGLGECITLDGGPNTNWSLHGQAQQPLAATALSYENGLASQFRVEPKEYYWRTGDPPLRLASRDDGFCVLTSVAGELRPKNKLGITVDKDGWFLSGNSAVQISARALHLVPKTPGTVRLRVQEYSWQAKQPPVKMIPAADGICFLAGVGGHFQGYGESVVVKVEADGNWYLTGQAIQSSVNARAISVELERGP